MASAKHSSPSAADFKRSSHMQAKLDFPHFPVLHPVLHASASASHINPRFLHGACTRGQLAPWAPADSQPWRVCSWPAAASVPAALRGTTDPWSVSDTRAQEPGAFRDSSRRARSFPGVRSQPFPSRRHSDADGVGRGHGALREHLHTRLLCEVRGVRREQSGSDQVSDKGAFSRVIPAERVKDLLKGEFIKHPRLLTDTAVSTDSGVRLNILQTAPINSQHVGGRSARGESPITWSPCAGWRWPPRSTRPSSGRLMGETDSPAAPFCPGPTPFWLFRVSAACFSSAEPWTWRRQPMPGWPRYFTRSRWRFVQQRVILTAGSTKKKTTCEFTHLLYGKTVWRNCSLELLLLHLFFITSKHFSVYNSNFLLL